MYLYLHSISIEPKKTLSQNFDPFMVDMLMAHNAYGEALA